MAKSKASEAAKRLAAKKSKKSSTDSKADSSSVDSSPPQEKEVTLVLCPVEPTVVTTSVDTLDEVLKQFSRDLGVSVGSIVANRWVVAIDGKEVRLMVPDKPVQLDG